MSIKIKTERLNLQPFKTEDAFRVMELANNEELAHTIGLPYPYKFDYAKEWIESQPDLLEKGVEFPLAIISKELSLIIGTITLRVDQSNNMGELGYWIGREFWGQGFATEAVNGMVHFGFHELHLNKIGASAISRNRASINVLMKAGLKKEGALRQHKRLLENYEDVEVFGLLRGDFLTKE